MKLLDPMRADIVTVIGHLEEAITALMPGQAPSSTADEIEEAIAGAAAELGAASERLVEINSNLLAVLKGN